ncbi:unnamed protein product [Arabidopsis thaliana]|uniref:BTB domain-containing protein n=2 Tax=Arabidopsis TaxID=3701 RepID=A0A5S9WXC3_ARATH|nr:unnamed protein product [Arabidopsis thaliana]VYS52094.1 unnamed protein product [Arabidopsis thaliana]
MATQTNQDHFSGGLAKILAENWQVDVRLKAVDSDEGIKIGGLKKMLESDEFKTSAKQVGTITLLEMKQEELEAFVEFLYSDGSMLSSKVKQHARALYRAADKYEILQLRELCRSELISSLNSKNSLNLLELAQIPFDKVLNDAAFSYIKTNELMFPSFDEFKVVH